MIKNLFILESSILGASYIYNAAKNLNMNAIFLTNLSNQEGDALKQITQYQNICCDTTNFNELLEIITAFGDNCAGVITLLDSRLEIMADLNDALGIDDAHQAIKLLKDKAYVNNIIPNYVPKSIEFNTDNINMEQISLFMESLSNNVIAKPRFTAGACGIFKIKHIKELEELIVTHQKYISKHLNPNNYTLQEFCKGELVSVEGYVLNNQITFIGISGRRKTLNTETSIMFPYQSHLNNSTYEKCKQIISELVQKSQFSTGFFHIEFIVTEKKVKLIDANMGRPGGGNVVEVISHAYGITPVEFFENFISITINKKEIIQPKFWSSPINIGLGITYGIQISGVIYSITLPNDIMSTHTLAVNLGNKISALGTNNWSIVGSISGSPKNVNNDIRKIKILTNYGMVKPSYTSFKNHVTIDYI